VGIFTAVRAENTGILKGHHSGVSHDFMTGLPKRDGEFPGAKGAQFTGKLIHDPHPNPHLSPLERLSTIVDISLTDSSEKPISSTFPHDIFDWMRFEVSDERLVLSHMDA
jgi:hypothetical protein